MDLKIIENTYIRLIADSLSIIFFLSMILYIPYGLDKKGTIPWVLVPTGLISFFYIFNNIWKNKSIFFIKYGILGKWNYRLMCFIIFIGCGILFLLYSDPRIISYKFFFEQILNINLEWPIRFAILTWSVWFACSLLFNHHLENLRFSKELSSK